MLQLNKSYWELQEYLGEVPVIDTHEHNIGVTKPLDNVLYDLFVAQYFISDLQSAGMDRVTSDILENGAADFETRFQIFEKFYKKTCYTGYAAGIRAGLKACWGIEDLTRSSFHALEEKMPLRNELFYNQMTERYKIKATIADVFFLWGMGNYVDIPTPAPSNITRFAFSLPSYHLIRCKTDVLKVQKYLDREIGCLDDYTEAFENCLKKYIEFGIVCIKDQSAYTRSIHFPQRSKADADAAFDRIMKTHSTTDGAQASADFVLSDWLFHHFMDLAKKFELPVQIHTGHLAGEGQDVARANAGNFISVLKQHPETRFDLFHGNWPYMGELLYVGKSFANVNLDLCWVNTIDPLYSIELMKRAVMTMPHSKVFAFGGDTAMIELSVGYLLLAKENLARAFSELVDAGSFIMADAKQVAADWLYNYPNEYFKLGFKPFQI